MGRPQIPGQPELIAEWLKAQYHGVRQVAFCKNMGVNRRTLIRALRRAGLGKPYPPKKDWGKKPQKVNFRELVENKDIKKPIARAPESAPVRFSIDSCSGSEVTEPKKTQIPAALPTAPVVLETEPEEGWFCNKRK
jgi:hypothetical protein